MTESELMAILKRVPDTITEYVTCPRRGMIGAIHYIKTPYYKNHHYGVASYFGEGDMRDIENNYITCREFKTRKAAHKHAADILNMNEPVNIAAIF